MDQHALRSFSARRAQASKMCQANSLALRSGLKGWAGEAAAVSIGHRGGPLGSRYARTTVHRGEIESVE